MATVCDRYEISIPGDLSDNMQDLGQQAIAEAEQRTRIYAVPALWEARPIKGEVGDNEVIFLVTRKRNKK